MKSFAKIACGICLVALCGSATAAEKGLTPEKPYQALYRQGVAANKKGDLDEAIRLYTQAIALKGDSAVLYFVRGRAYKMKDQYDSAIKDFAKAVQLKPDYADAYNHRGVTYIGKGDTGKARADFQKACQLGLPDACANVKKLSTMK